MMAAAPITPHGELRHDEPMARHTTWRVGGPARRWYRPADMQDLTAFLSGLSADEPLYWVGLGSNLLVRDGGLDGTVVSTAGTLGGLDRLDGERVAVEAGTACAKLARFCARERLAGAAFLAGIPGTVGGALAMNAGCFGSEVWGLVESVETVDRFGNRRRHTPDAFDIGYRRVAGAEGEWFVSAVLRLHPGDTASETAQMREFLDRRAATQPLGEPNAGSVFRNPPGDHAARLIEAADLKGWCVGDACVSTKHANFIVNRGTARAAEIEALITEVQAVVWRRHGVRLEPEVRIVGREAVQ